MKDKKYLQALANGLGITDTKSLSVIMGPDELKDTLSGLKARDYDDGKRLITLHTHTQASDGQLDALSYLKNAISYKNKYGYQTLILGVTDHDGLGSLPTIVKEVSQNPNRYQGIRIVLGCELSLIHFDTTMLRPIDFEILHYGINPFDQEYNQWFCDLRKLRQQALPQIFEFFHQKYPNDDFSIEEFLAQNPLMKNGFGNYLVYITPQYLCSKIKETSQHPFIWDYFRRIGTILADNPKIAFWHTLDDVITQFKKHGFGFLSVAHPYRIQLDGKISGSGPDFLYRFLTTLHHKGIEGAEIFYANLKQPLSASFDKLYTGGTATTDSDYWVKTILDFANNYHVIKTGGTDSHIPFLGSRKKQILEQLKQLWNEYKPLVREGYRILNKEVTLGLPAPCMPPETTYKDTGIGSAYGTGAHRIFDFFGGIFDKIQLGPMGKTYPETKYSPYVSDLKPNPFLLPLEKLAEQGLLSEKTLTDIYNTTKTDGKISFDSVEKNYEKALKAAYKNSKTKLSYDDFIQDIFNQYTKQTDANYITDLQVKIPNDTPDLNNNLFLKGYSLGSPADAFCPHARNWHFPVFNPDLLFTQDGQLGPAGQVWYNIIDKIMATAKGGLRIDHYIAFVNPFVVSDTNPDDCGRLYSSPNHPVLGRFAKNSIEQFGDITEKIILNCAKKHNLTVQDIYTEDIGSRPAELDSVMERFGLGRLLVAQFAEPTDWQHMYHLKNAKPNDIAVLDTHDTPSVQMFFDSLSPDRKVQFAWMLASDLRFHYNDDLKQLPQLVRMQWGALLASPANRIQAFFTSWTGQIGRYNTPGNPDKWTLRCVSDFEYTYFKNFARGLAYNPFDAIALAIYARGDEFYQQNEDLVHRLRQAEEKLYHLVQEL